MNRDEYLAKGPFSVKQEEKDRFFQAEMNRLTEHHRRACKAYDDICNGVKEAYLPVALFKDLSLCSVREEEVVRKLTSSGTTGQNVSKIFLDAETSAAQQRALCMITGDFIGGDRIPMLIIDSPDVLRDRKKYSARGAGIMGFSMMSSRRFYALDSDMNLDLESIRAFIETAKGGPCFAFGFTFMIWQYFYKALKESALTQSDGTKAMKIDLSNCYLIHGGGWKKLRNEMVSDQELKRGLQEVCNIKRVSDYYGMAEQTGSIFMQCEEGHLHASIYSDIEILNPKDFTACEVGEWGLIALKSILPESYPGHMLLTEDWGRINGVDDCPCGRLGKYFEIKGRIAKAEVRGCSDTFMAAESCNNEGIEIKAGIYPTRVESSQAFDGLTISFLEELSKFLMKETKYRRFTEIYALGFWCRKSHLMQIKERAGLSSLHGRGLVLHIAPSNMPTMFAYSWITALLAGNSNVVRISGKENEISEALIEGINSLLCRPEYEDLKRQNAILKFPRDDRALEELSLKASARVIWGGDETVRNISAIPKAKDCIDLTFPDKYSIGLMNAEYISQLDEGELKRLAHYFYNDTYGVDQNACSSPKTIFWIDKEACGEGSDTSLKNTSNRIAKAKNRWWNAVAEEAERYEIQPWIATEKYRIICCSYARINGGKPDGHAQEVNSRNIKLNPIKAWGNSLYVIPGEISNAEGPEQTRLEDLEAKFGIFYEFDIKKAKEIFSLFDAKIQTLVSCGNDDKRLWNEIREAACPGVDRIVSIGEALDFDTTWDRKDMIRSLSD